MDVSIFWEQYLCNGLFTLPETDLDTDSDSNSKPCGYIVLYRNCSHCMEFDCDPKSDPQLLPFPFLGQISVPESESESVFGNVNKPLNA